MRKYVFLNFVFLIGFSASSSGQEVLLDLQSIPTKVEKVKKTSAQAKAKALLTLPFFDDFSNGLTYPNSDKWVDSYVIINQEYAISPPTIGVATFDAINQYGNIYDHLTTSSLPADTLTSQPIDLNLPESDSLYFSFQYQPKGLGKEPQIDDSLVIEFLSKDDNKWIRAWSASANFEINSVIENHHLEKKVVTLNATEIATNFFKVMLPINDERFRKAGFQLRFINYASLQTNTQIPSIRGNGDHWNIDLVYLNSYRYLADTILNDITLSKPVKSFLKNYESIPWLHFTGQAKLAELTDPLSFNMQYSNLGSITWNVTRRFVINDLSNASNNYYFSGGAENISPFQIFNFTQNYEYTYNSSWEDSAKFSMENYLITDNDDSTQYLRENDTARYTQQFFNYYAYDDGSAENGYGVWGEGSENAMIALKYHSYVSDSLKGVLIYFNQIYDDYNTKLPFKLTVWKDNNGEPGDTLYQKYVLKPALAYNKDTLYKIDAPLKIGGDFWVGWVNTTTDALNVGFDLNNVHNDKLFYNRSGDWVQSQFEGSLMVKPVFGKFAQGQTGVDKPAQLTEFTIYPNPATNQINLNLSEGTHPERIRIVNLAGQVVLNKVYENSSIDISNLSTGVYLFQLTLRNRTTTTKKLVIIR
jgi:hypothetical protein